MYCRALQEKGAHVTCVEDGLPTWVAEVIIQTARLDSILQNAMGQKLPLMPLNGLAGSSVG